MNPRHSSEHNEHYSPTHVVEAARSVLGEIDLDPASSELANRTVRAARIFTIEDDGFDRPWHGRVFLNPPGGRRNGSSSQKAWWFKLAREYQEGRVTSAVFLSFSIELLQTSQVDTPIGLLTPHDLPICYPRTRIAYLSETNGELAVGRSPPHASMIVYLPPREDPAPWRPFVNAFGHIFGHIGRIVVPYYGP